MTFDPAKLGLESHYNQAQRDTIHRLILEDWEQSDIKLPSYMKQIALFIMPEKVPDEWLKKLLYQTLSKMLKRESIPRHEFWACLHLYLIKKHGDIGISKANTNALERLGKMLMRFSHTQPESLESGTYRVYDSTAMRFDAGTGFQLVVVIHRKEAADEHSDPVYTVYEGASIKQGDHFMAIVRNLSTKALKTIEVTTEQLVELVDPDMTERLDQLMEVA